MHVDMSGVSFFSPLQGKRDGVLRSTIRACSPEDGEPRLAHRPSQQEYAGILDVALTEAKSHREFLATHGDGRWVWPVLCAGEAGVLGLM